MHKLITSALMILALVALRAETPNSSFYIVKNSAFENILSTNEDDDDTFILVPTQNMWTFIKLNTRNGRMWQVQYDVEDNNRFESFLNLKPLVSTAEEKNGRFALYPTQNVYNFILLDQVSGKTWQVQWSTDFENRFVLPIE